MKTKSKLAYARLPRDYTALCRLFLPRPIHDRVTYGNTLEIAEAFAGFEAEMSADQSDYCGLLCTLVKQYEEEKAPHVRPLELLRHILEEAGLNASDLSRILGVTAQLGSAILRGDRSITAEHARALGKHFAMDPGVFVA